MGFTEDITKLSEQVRKRVDQVVGEEATKMALIVPFLKFLAMTFMIQPKLCLNT
jgi:hypothetical protein